MTVSKPKETIEKLVPFIRDPHWLTIVAHLLDKHKVLQKLTKEREKGELIFPSQAVMFRAFSECPWDDLKVIILSQDPYYTPGVADGLAFSTKNTKFPPSLMNIMKEVSENIYNGLNVSLWESPDLTRWANQGVLLLNTALTVRANEPESHLEIWKDFTKGLIEHICEEKEDLVFLLWGEKAKKYDDLIIDKYRHRGHMTYMSGHPSPMSVVKFRGNGHFRKTNDYLTAIANKEPIIW